jgi:hypothetical protein
MSVCAMEHGDLGLRVVLEFDKRGVQGASGLCVHGVAYIGARQGDERNGASALAADGCG